MSDRCPRCGAALGADQSWCTSCGHAARTRIAPTPAWRVPLVALGLLVALFGAALAFAFVRLAGTDDDLAAERVTRTTITQTTTTTTPPPPPPTTTETTPPTSPGGDA